MKEIRKLYSGKLRSLCIKERWYTYGTNESYSRLLKKVDKIENLSTQDIIEIATNIFENSEVYDNYSEKEQISCKCFEISKVCDVFFEV